MIEPVTARAVLESRNIERSTKSQDRCSTSAEIERWTRYIPPHSTLFEPLLNNVIPPPPPPPPPPQKNTLEPTLGLYLIKKTGALRRPPLKLHYDKHYHARYYMEKCGEGHAMYFTWCWSGPHHTFVSITARNRIESRKSTPKKNWSINRIAKNWLMSTALVTALERCMKPDPPLWSFNANMPTILFNSHHRVGTASWLYNI